MAKHVILHGTDGTDASVSSEGFLLTSLRSTRETFSAAEILAPGDIPVGTFQSTQFTVSNYSKLSVALYDQQTDVTKAYIVQLLNTSGSVMEEITLRPSPSEVIAGERSLFYGNIDLNGIFTVRLTFNGFSQEGYVIGIFYAST